MEPVRSIASPLSVGIDARRALTPGAAGTVEAVFRRSVYLQLPDGWACFGAAEIGNGPINVPCRDGPEDWRAVGLDGLSCAVSHGAVVIGGRGRITLAAPVWAPDPPPAWTPESLDKGLDQLERLLPPDIPAEGLGCYARRLVRPEGLAARAAEAPVAGIAAWLEGDEPHAPAAAVAGLLGLGPGLTPSGDDLLGGCMVALRAVGRGAVADVLWRAVEENGPDATNPISLAHLAAAARGRLAERLHHLLDAILAGDGGALEDSLQELAGEEHSSPWDTLAGIALALWTVSSCT